MILQWNLAWTSALTFAAGIALWSTSVSASPGVVWDQGPDNGGGWNAYITVDALGNEILRSTTADDFVLADTGGSGNAVVVTSANFIMVLNVPLADFENFKFEIRADNAGVPGAVIFETIDSRAIFLSVSGTLSIYRMEFENFAVALQPGVRYWALSAGVKQTLGGSFRRTSTSNPGLPSVRVLNGGAIIPLGVPLTQTLLGFQVPNCPPPIIEAPFAGKAAANYRAVAGFAQSGRILRNNPPTSCEAPTPCGIFFTTGERRADLYAFQNTSPWPACIRITHENGDPACQATYCVAYSEQYIDTELCTNYLGDPGSSCNPMQMSFLVSPGETFFIVVHEVNTSGSGAPYTLRVDGLPGCCTPTCLGDANQDLTVNFADITSVLGNWLDDCSTVPVGTFIDPQSGEFEGSSGLDDTNQP